MSDVGKVKDWHDPHRADCPNNADPFENCNCKRVRKHNPFKRVMVHDANVGHNVSPNIVLEIWPKNGVLVLREKRRRKRYSTTTADVYGWLVRREALALSAARRGAQKRRSR